MLAAGYFLARKKSKKEKAFYMMNTSGYNIGAFTMPFVQSFLSPFCMVAACMFDVGNAIMCTGGSYALLSSTLLQEGKQRGRAASFFKKLFSSVSFDAYLLLLVLSFFSWTATSSPFWKLHEKLEIPTALGHAGGGRYV